MENVTDRTSNPFGMSPPCERFVPGYGDANADFHLVGDHPGVHGGCDTGVPFTNAAGRRLLSVLAAASLLDSPESNSPDVENLFCSYLHLCVTDEPSPESYDDCERFFDAELRAIGAHVLLPVGERATAHVIRTYTARQVPTPLDMDALHATEIRGSGWLVIPIKEPAEWTDDSGEAEQLETTLKTLLATDYRRETDLGRFLPGGDPYLVR